MNFVTIDKKIKQISEINPNKVAIEHKDEKVTYAELDRNSDIIANFLMNKYEENNNVFVLMEKSPRLIESMIGIIKSNGIFIPLDFNTPDNRILSMFNEVSAGWIITTTKFLEKINNICSLMGGVKLNILLIESFEPVVYSDYSYLNIFSLYDEQKNSHKVQEYCQNKHCYIYFTSGSTGKPKAVLGRHKSLVQFIEWEIKEFKINSDFIGSQLINSGFDAFLRDVLVPLFAGGKICIPESQDIIFNPFRLIDWIKEKKISLIHTVPSLFKMILSEVKDSEDLTYLKYILVAGEPLRGNDVEKFIKLFYPRIKLVNLYGTTETTMAKSFYIIKEGDEEKANIPVGKGIDYAELLVLNDNMQICPRGVIGQVYIRTPFITSGYCNDKELTKKVFIKNPLFDNPNDIIYKTGDLGKRLDDDNIEVLGRIDNQVKIRGNRIDLGEVENRLLKHQLIDEAIVIDKIDEFNYKYLCAYLVLNCECNINEIKKYLSQYLPKYMIPEHFIVIDKMPLTGNCKIDRNKLSLIEKVEEKDIKQIEPVNDIEKKLVDMCLDILRVKSISTDSNIFEYGAHSLSIAKLTAEIFKKFNVEMSFEKIINNPTIKQLAKCIEDSNKSGFVQIKPVEEREYYPISSSQRRMFILNLLHPENTNYNVPIALKIKGKLDILIMENVFNKLMLRHEIFRTYFDIIDGEPIQKIDKETSISLKYTIATEEEAQNMVMNFVKPFNVKNKELIRCDLITISEESHILLIDMHHILLDGYSINILMDDFIKLYKEEELDDLEIQYKDFAVWENEFLASKKLKQQEEFWLDMFKKEEVKLNMPLDFPRTKINKLNGKSLNFSIEKDIIDRMNDISKKNQTTLYIVIHSIYKILLSKYSGQEDVTSGILLSGRTHPDMNNIIGTFINFLPVRSNINVNDTFIEFLAKENELIMKVYDNQNYPFDDIVKSVVKENDNNRNPLFDTILNLLLFDVSNDKVYDNSGRLKLDNLSFEQININANRKTSRLDFQIDGALDVHGNLRLTLEYNTQLFLESTMTNFIKHFKMLINTVINNSDIKLSDIDIFTEQEIKSIKRKRLNSMIESNRLKIAIASTFTDGLIKDYINWWCKQFKKEVCLEFAPYNQVFQQLMDKNSLIYKNGHVNVILVRFEDWIRNAKSETEMVCLLEKSFNDFIKGLEFQGGEGTYLIGLFPLSEHIEINEKIKNSLELLYCKTEEFLQSRGNMHLMDLRNIHNIYNIETIFDPIRDKIAHIPFTDEYYAAIGTFIARNICALKNNPFKVIVLDCDNTLWKGICGEVGCSGVEIDESYRCFQKFLIEKYNEGMLLALCSKNNEKDVLEVFDNNENMILKKDHLVSWKINWNSKSDNIKELANELNLGLDSFIFIDDNALECSRIMIECPEVLTLQLPKDSTIIPIYLKHIWAFDKVKVTNEDRNRNKMYKIEKQRAELRNNINLIDDFLSDLQLKIKIDVIKEKYIERISQLTQRTNQFNSSTIRRSEKEIAELMGTENNLCWVIDVEDRFGKYGIVGTIIAEKQNSSLVIESFILSCRVLGRKVEEVILNELVKYCKKVGIEKIQINFNPTSKNRIFEDFLSEINFEKKCDNNTNIVYSANVNNIWYSKDFIECCFDECLDSEHDNSSSINHKKHFEIYDKKSYSNKIHHWQALIENEEKLLYLNYLLALNCNTGKSLLDIPVHIQHKGVDTNRVIIAPTNETEEKLMKIWCEVLNIKHKISINDDFFSLGGHSLKATSLLAKIQKEFNAEMPLIEIFKTPTIKQISEYIMNSKPVKYQGLNKLGESEYYNVSSAQKRLFALNQLAKDETNYNISSIIEIEGNIDKYKIENVFKKIIERHEAFRTTFHIENQKIIQKVHRKVDFNMEFAEIDEPEKEEIKNAVNKFLKPFDLANSPLLRVKLLKVGYNKHLLMIDMNHIISDGTSISIIIEDFIKLYKGEELEELRVQYKDYAAWHNELLSSQDMKEQEEYWLGVFSDSIPVLDMPTDFPRPEIQNFKGSSIKVSIDKLLLNDLKELSKKNGVTLYMTLLSAFNVLLYRYSGQEDLVIGSPIEGRNHVDLEKIVGMFVNTLAMRNYPEGNKTFKDFLYEVKKNSLDAYENQNYPFEILVEKLNLSRDVSRNPLFDVMFTMQNMKFAEIVDFDLKVKKYEQERNSVQFDLALTAIELEDKMLFELEYCTSLYKLQTIERMIEHYVNILKSIVNNINTKLSNIDMITEIEKRKLLYEFNDTFMDFPNNKVLHELFEDQVEKTPNKIAAVFQKQYLTYRQLNEKSNKLSIVLREKGVEPNCIVGLMLNRSLNMLVAILAVLKAGGAYMPIDPECPEERVEYILKDSNAFLLLTEQCFLDKMSFHCEAININDNRLYEGEAKNLPNKNTCQDLAYVIYTSGSTGKPKGAMVEHVGMINHLYAKINTLGINNNSIIAQNASYCFDISVWQFLASIVCGGSVIIYSKEIAMNPELLLTNLINDKVNILEIVPSFMSVILDILEVDFMEFKNLKYVVVTGEALNRSLVERWFKIYPGIKLVNAYGPTEASDDITHYIMDEPPVRNIVPIGKPVQNFSIYIVNKDMALCPLGIAGEIVVSGIGVGRGYLNNTEMTNKCFMQDPFCLDKKRRLYKTGDIGRWLEDGNIEFLGRIDHQVKVRGNRIELGEIESRLLEHENIKEVVVVDKQDKNNNLYLCAYIVLSKELSIESIREHLLKTMPDYMVPSYFVSLNNIPLNANGKVDRKMLPEPKFKTDKRKEYKGAKNDIEQKLLTVWKEVLGNNDIGTEDNFFELGGDSIKAIQITSKMKQYNYILEMKDLFKNPEITNLSRFVKHKNLNLINTDYQGYFEGKIDLTPIQKWFFEKKFKDMHHWNQSVMLYSKEGFDLQKLKVVFNEIVKHHDALRMKFVITENEVEQINRGIDGELYTIEMFDVRNISNCEENIRLKCDVIQSSFDLENGPLIKLALFKTNDGDHLLIVVHHLVIDGVSWRILFEDISSAYGQLSRNEKISLQPKTASFKEWSKRIHDFAASRQINKDLMYWSQVDVSDIKSLSKDFNIKRRIVENSESVSIKLSTEETDLLLKSANKAYKTQINDILLTALGIALKKWTGQNKFLVQLEGHGRHDLINGLDISRTVGWFTAHYPVKLDISEENDIQYEIQETKKNLSSIPSNGIGYGILKYLAHGNDAKNEIFNVKPEIIFNYLGQFDNDISTDEFIASTLSTGKVIGSNNESEYAISINAIVMEGQLNIVFTYNQTEYMKSSIISISNLYKQTLVDIIDNCKNLVIDDMLDFNAESHLKDTIMELLNDKKNKNIFAFPPISGYGLCYVQLSRLIDFYSLYAFDFIEDEDRIEQYVDLIINEQKEGPYTLVGYCIGGNLAFEVGKALESKGYEVADIILIDSDFLEEKEKDLAYYNELNNRIDNMVKNIKEFVSTNYPSMIEYVDKNIKRKINCYSNYEENIISEGVVNANLHNILSLSGELDKKIKLSNLWIKSTSKNLLIYKGFGTHNEMLNDGYVKENSEIIKDILSKNSTDKYLINEFLEI